MFTVLHPILFISFIIVIKVFSTPLPTNADRDWLTLATSSSDSVDEGQASLTDHQSLVQVSQPYIGQHQHQEGVDHPVTQQAQLKLTNEKNALSNTNKRPTKERRKNKTKTNPKPRGKYVRTEEVKERQRAYWTPEKRLKQQERYRKLRLGILLSQEAKGTTLPPHNKGKKGIHLSEATREKMRKSHIGKKASEETKQKMRDAKKRSRERKQNLASLAEKGAQQ